MKKKILILGAVVLVLAVVAVLTTDGTENNKTNGPPPTPNVMVPSLMVDGVLYRVSPQLDHWLETPPDPADYLGTVTSQVPLTQMPTRDGESNCHAPGTPYVACEEGIAVQESPNGGWHVFVPAE